MGKSSNKSSSAGNVVSCVFLGLALLVVGAAAAPDRSSPNSCKAQCAGREDYKPCRAACLWGLRLGAHGSTEGENSVGGIGEEVNCHLRCRHAKVYDTCYKQCKSETGGVAARGEGVELLLAAPAEGQKQEEEKMKKFDTALHLPGWLCEFFCEEEFGTSSDAYIQCCRECYPPNRNAVRRGEEGEEARGEGDGGSGFLATVVGRAGREEEDQEGKRKQDDVAVHLSYDRKDYCYDLCISKKGLEFPKCFQRCVQPPTLARVHKQEIQARGSWLLATPAKGTVREEEVAVKREDAVVHLTVDCERECQHVVPWRYMDCITQCVST